MEETHSIPCQLPTELAKARLNDIRFRMNQRVLNTKSTELPGTIASESPSLTEKVMCRLNARRHLHSSMHFSVTSTSIRRSQRPFKNWVHRPNLGAISSIVFAATKACIRGSIG